VFDNFQEKSMTNIGFDNIMDGKVLDKYDNDGSLIIYVPQFMVSISDSTQVLNATETIGNPEIVQPDTNRKTVNTTNGIICKPLIKNQELIVPEVGESVLVIFLDGNPERPYYINYNLYGNIHQTSLIKEMKESGSNINILNTIDEFSMIYDKDTKCYIVNNDRVKVVVCPDSIKLFIDGKELDLKGDKGDPGENGKDGKDGINGVDGKDGKDGEPGLDGKDGVDGKDGRDGVDGKDGVDGENGRDGINGIDGEKGEPGEKGDPGEPKDWNSLEGKPSGEDGQAYFVKDGDTVKLDYTLHSGIFVENEVELNDAKGREVTFKEVFDTWQRFSHERSVDTQPAREEESQAWNYDAAKDQVVCSVNSTSYIGFISNDKYDSFIHEATILSGDGDDDMIGLIASFAKDSNGREHTISAIRVRTITQNHITADGQNLQWALVYNYGQKGEKVLASKVVPGDAQGAWSGIPNGVRIRIRRQGDVIEAYTSSTENTNLIEESVLSVNLNDHSELSLFKGAQSYGFSCLSQNKSTFKDLYFVADNLLIYDLRNRDVWIFENYKWILDPEKDLYKDIGIGKFLLNKQTNKLFYVLGIDNVERVLSQSYVPAYYSNERPVLNLYDGKPIYDKTLKMPLWYDGDGRVWRDAIANKR
jgi:Collagen triple helix repeat (20 copies)